MSYLTRHARVLKRGGNLARARSRRAVEFTDDNVPVIDVLNDSRFDSIKTNERKAT
jgi:hypothetical protein